MGRINPMNGQNNYLVERGQIFILIVLKKLKNEENQGIIINQKVDDSFKSTINIKVFEEREERKRQEDDLKCSSLILSKCVI